MLEGQEEWSKAIIRITTLQRATDGGDEEVIELVTQGKCCTRGDALVLEYMESELSGMDGTKTSLELGEDRVVMSRQGEFASVMEFEAGKRMKAMYPTGQGNVYIEFLTTKIDIQRKKDPFFVQADIVYTMAVRHLFEGQNELRIIASKLDNQ